MTRFHFGRALRVVVCLLGFGVAGTAIAAAPVAPVGAVVAPPLPVAMPPSAVVAPSVRVPAPPVRVAAPPPADYPGAPPAAVPAPSVVSTPVPFPPAPPVLSPTLSPAPPPPTLSPAPPPPRPLPPYPDLKAQRALPLLQAFLPSLRTLSAEEGVVRFALVTNDVRGRRPDVVTVASSTGRFEIRPVSDGFANNLGLYAAVLPAGRYYLAAIADRVTFRWIDFNAAAQGGLGTFEVRAGQSADLGTLMLTPNIGAWLIGRSLDVAMPAEAWREAAPATEKVLARLSAGGGWTGEAFQQRWFDINVERGPVGLQGLRELPDGRVLAPSALGKLLVRGVDGQWSTLTAPRPWPLLWATAGAAAGEYVALTEWNRFVVFAADGTSREVPLRGLPSGRALFITRSPQGDWYLAQEIRGAMRLYRAAALDAERWEEVGSVQLTQSVWSGNRGAWAVETPDGVLLVQGSKGLLRHFRYATRAWEDRSLTGSRDIQSVDIMPDGTVSVLTIAAGGFAGIFSGAWVSRDYGANWQELNTGYNVKVSPLVVPGDGRVLQAGGVFGESGIKVSTDNGKTWKQLTEALPVETRLFQSRQNGLFAIRRIAEVHDVLLRSPDGGANWVYEWSSIGRVAVERLLKVEADERAAKAAKREAAKKKN